MSSVTLNGLPTTTTGVATISLNILGDVDGGPFGGEILTISLDGVSVGTFQGGVGCVPTTTMITVPQAILAPLIVDGQLQVSFDGSPGVNNICDGSAFGLPAAPLVSYVVNGTLAYTGGTPPVVPSATNTSVARFLENRARSLVQNQPDILRFVDGRSGGSFDAEVTQGNSRLSFATAAKGPFWADLRGSNSTTGTGEQTYFLGSFGGHLRFGKNAIGGAMLQYDQAESTVTGGDSVNGSGWLVGPYFAAQVSDFPLFVDGRLLFGKTDNEVTPTGSPTDSFDGDRWLAILGLEGKVPMQNITMFPGLRVSHVRDSQDAYTDSSSALIPPQEVERTEVALNLNFEKPLAASGGDLVLTWGLATIWSETTGSGTSAAIVGADDGWRGRLDIGFLYTNSDGLSARVNAFSDGVGSDDLDGYGLSATLSFSY